MIIKSVDTISVAKVFGFLYALLGIVVGGFIALLSLAGAGLGQNADAGMMAVFGVGAVVALPIFYGICGFIGGLLMGLLYNVTSGIVGGIEFETDRVFETSEAGGPIDTSNFGEVDTSNRFAPPASDFENTRK